MKIARRRRRTSVSLSPSSSKAIEFVAIGSLLESSCNALVGELYKTNFLPEHRRNKRRLTRVAHLRQEAHGRNVSRSRQGKTLARQFSGTVSGEPDCEK